MPGAALLLQKSFQLLTDKFGSLCRFIDDNALPVVLPAVKAFADTVFAYTNNSFKTTKEVRDLARTSWLSQAFFTH